MEKRTVIITGGNSGLGYQCAKNIANRDNNYNIILACRNKERASSAVRRLKEETGNKNIYSIELDLSSLDSVRNSYKEFCDNNFGNLYGIVCNAGFNRQPLEYTKDGFEAHFGACHLGHFLFVNLFLNKMSENGRIIFVSSDMHKPPKLMSLTTPKLGNVEDIAFLGKNKKATFKEKNLRYSMAKLCNILCVYEMADRLRKINSKITVNAFNPGLMTDTNFMPPMNSKMLNNMIKGGSTLVAKTTNRYGSGLNSGKALSNLITEDRFEGISGKYFDRTKETPINSSKPSYDKNARIRLWEESVRYSNLQEKETILPI